MDGSSSVVFSLCLALPEVHSSILLVTKSATAALDNLSPETMLAIQRRGDDTKWVAPLPPSFAFIKAEHFMILALASTQRSSDDSGCSLNRKVVPSLCSVWETITF